MSAQQKPPSVELHSIFVVTVRFKNRRTSQPLCFLEVRQNAQLYIDMLREDGVPEGTTFHIREIKKGVINVTLN
ncbi:hypothetical protein ABE493_07690 [Stenotrophomonas terrae]|uniref:hypothetical protein n=1 Tax=Stenotrophomonas terrae TaxID=405446 RepID=UPI00320908F4